MQSDKKATPAGKAKTPAPSQASTSETPVKSATVKKKAAKATTKTTTKTATKTAAKAAPKTATKAAAKTATKNAKAPAKGAKAAGKLTLRFEILFSTKFGEVLLISGAHPALGGESTDLAPTMQYLDEQKWTIQFEVDKSSIIDGQLDYTYLVRYEDGSLALSAPYRLSIPAAVNSITIRDAWNAPGFIENAFGTDALQFISGIEDQTPKTSSGSKKKYTHRFVITAPALPAGKAVCLIGQEDGLGEWDAAKAIVLTRQTAGKWSVDLSLKLSAPASAYKYGIYDLTSGRLESFEAGDNRTLTNDPAAAELLVLQNGFIRTN